MSRDPEQPRLMRNPAVTETPLDDEVFLVEPGSDEVYYLDAVSSGRGPRFRSRAV